jgi:hypothetical protein
MLGIQGFYSVYLLSVCEGKLWAARFQFYKPAIIRSKVSVHTGVSSRPDVHFRVPPGTHELVQSSLLGYDVSADLDDKSHFDRGVNPQLFEDF